MCSKFDSDLGAEGRFLAFNLTTPDIPRGFNAEKNTSAMIDYHLKVIESQLRELRDGLAIAVALNRIVIMPKVRQHRRTDAYRSSFSPRTQTVSQGWQVA